MIERKQGAGMPKSIPRDSTIKTVWPHLTHQRPYVSGVLHKMRQCNVERGNSAVKIGILGTGQKPYYRVFSLAADGAEVIFGSYYDNHDPLESGFAETANWSIEFMPFEELLNFYAAAIGYKGKIA
jgi:hypothetical protein